MEKDSLHVSRLLSAGWESSRERRAQRLKPGEADGRRAWAGASDLPSSSSLRLASPRHTTSGRSHGRPRRGAEASEPRAMAETVQVKQRAQSLAPEKHTVTRGACSGIRDPVSPGPSTGDTPPAPGWACPPPPRPVASWGRLDVSHGGSVHTTEVGTPHRSNLSFILFCFFLIEWLVKH